MKLFLVLICTFVSLSSVASLDEYFDSKEMKKMCEHSVHITETRSRTFGKVILATDQYVYMGLGANGEGRVVIKNRLTNNEKIIDFDRSIQNIQTQDDLVMITTTEELIVLSKIDNHILFRTRTLPNHMSYSRFGEAFGVYKYKHILYIAHGRFGILPFDIKLMKHLPSLVINVPQKNERLKSLVTGITGKGNHLYLAYDNLTLSSGSKAFEGVLIFDLDKKKNIKAITVNQSREAYHNPSLTIDGEELVVTNENLNFRHNLKKLMRARKMKPLKRIWKYTHGDLIGRGHIENTKIYGCFKNRTTKSITSGWMSLK